LKYFEEIPIIRAVATMMVLGVHITSRLYYSQGHIVDDLLGYFNQISRLGTPVFAVISAFLLTSSTIRRKFDIKYFVKSRFTKIFMPYLIWTTIYLLLSAIFTNIFYAIDRPIKDYYLFGVAETHLYFILVVIQFYILFPVVHRVKKGPSLIYAYLIATIVNILWLIYGRGTFNFEIEMINTFINSRSFVLNWISFFFLGIVYAKYYSEINDLITRYQKYLYIIITILFIDLLASINLDSLFSSNTVSIIVYTPFFIIGLILFYRKIKSNQVLVHILTTIGNYSMGIYLVHIIIIMFYRKIPYVEIMGNTSTFVFSYLFVLSLSVLLVYGISKLPFATFIVPIPKKQNSVSLSKLSNKKHETEI